MELYKKERKFLVFAGTKEGRELAEYMSAHRIPAVVCVATEYGEELLQSDRWIQVRTGRMEKSGMEELIRDMEPLAVIDATHPYADVATANIRGACEVCGAEYYRLLREESEVKDFCSMREQEESGSENNPEKMYFFGSVTEAARWLEAQEGNILLATGIKELPCFAETISDRDRIYVRALLQNDIFNQMEKYGLSRKQMICMQGPFSKEMNAATLRMTGAKYLVTKESGAAGGFAEKVEAAKECGAVSVIIRRPVHETGYSARKIQKIVTEKWNACVPEHSSSENRAGNLSGRGTKYSACESPEDRAVCSDFDLRMKDDAAAQEYREIISVSDVGYVNYRRRMDENASYGNPGENPPRRITLLGIGRGSMGSMTTEAVQACSQADCIIGAKRMLDALQEFGKPMVSLYLSDEIAAFVDEHPEYRNIVVAFSGDVGFYSGAKKLLELLKDQENAAEREKGEDFSASGCSLGGSDVLISPNGCVERVECGQALHENISVRDEYEPHLMAGKKSTDHQGKVDIRLLPGISSVAYFAARLQTSWEDMTLVSSHGREQNLIGAVRCNEKVFTLASNAASIRSIAQKLVLYGLGMTKMYLGCDLSYSTEKIYGGIAEDFSDFDREGMYVALICNPKAGRTAVTHGIPDESFLRAKVPMTKEEVRSISLSKLQLTRDAIVYDVGAGTGSVSVECARMADRGRVYAIEWKEDAWKLVAENRKKFAVANLEIVPGRAPDVFEKLPAPTHVFIGGSGGSLRTILTTILRKNPDVRIVLNCVTLETLTEILTTADELGLGLEDVASVTVAKAARTGKYHLMTGQNPVYVITLVSREKFDFKET
ncbi:MAG: precorrin-6A reductase [Lachnospiraceae bacterium]|nr:precorrin-6A reductase [Lachnospiraceae bacterium]